MNQFNYFFTFNFFSATMYYCRPNNTENVAITKVGTLTKKNTTINNNPYSRIRKIL